MLKLNFSGNFIAQDMVSIIMRDKNVSAGEAVAMAITPEIYEILQDAGWAPIAFDLWGHAEPEKEMIALDDPAITVELPRERELLISNVMKQERIDVETAVGYFLVFMMGKLGYHI